jgi:hypothetical protein
MHYAWKCTLDNEFLLWHLLWRISAVDGTTLLHMSPTLSVSIPLNSPTVSANMDHVDTVLQIKRFLAANSRLTRGTLAAYSTLPILKIVSFRQRALLLFARRGICFSFLVVALVTLNSIFLHSASLRSK